MRKEWVNPEMLELEIAFGIQSGSDVNYADFGTGSVP